MSFRLSLTGDILAYRSLIKRSLKDPSSFYRVFEKIGPLLNSYDYVIGNLEMPFGGELAGYTAMDMSFNTPDSFAYVLKDSGFDMLTTANNHCLDRGIPGLIRTLDVLDNIGIEHTGTFRSIEEDHFYIKEVEGVKIGVIAYTYGTNPNVNGILVDDSNSFYVNLTKAQDSPYRRSPFKQWLLDNVIYNLPRSLQDKVHPIYPNHNYQDCVSSDEIDNPSNQPFIRRLVETIERAKRKADILIFSLHAGGQYNSYVGDYTRYLINLLKKTPIDVLIVNHPHCVLESNWSDKFVACSLGNFTFTPQEGYFIDGVYADYGIIINFDVDSRKKSIDSVSFTTIKNTVEDGIPRVTTVYDLFHELKTDKERSILVNDNSAVINRFLGTDNLRYDLSIEYDYRLLISKNFRYSSMG